jgi:hypothetical protein
MAANASELPPWQSVYQQFRIWRDSGVWEHATARAVSESRANYWASYVTDFTCPFLFAYLGMRHEAS